jgi:hypothetical protein
MLQRNTKTRLAPIARQRAGSDSATKRNSITTKQRDRRAKAASLLLIAFFVVSLAGCASGNAREAEPFATKDAEKTAVVPEAQQTALIQRFFPTPGAPTEEPTPIVVLESLVLTTSLGSNNEPQQEVRGVSGSGTLYADALCHYLTKGSVATAYWTNKDDTVVYSSEIPIDEDAESRWLAFQWNVDGSLPPGQYAVYIYIDSWMLSSLVFQLR